MVFNSSCIIQTQNTEELTVEKTIEKTILKKKNNFYFYEIGNPYFIGEKEYIPKEDYNYKEIGQASFFGKRFHGRKTANNEIINITKLTAAHQTLPLPSVLKVTNLENNTYVIVRVNDRGPFNNNDIIMVSRRVAELLDFYKDKTTQVLLEILPEESKHLKSVAKSVNNDEVSNTIVAAPTTDVSVTNID